MRKLLRWLKLAGVRACAAAAAAAAWCTGAHIGRDQLCITTDVGSA